jgi:type I restriction enzyme S subunit
MSDFPTVDLGDVLTVKYGKDHKKLAEGNIPCYGTGGIMRYVEEYLSEDESILLPRKGSLNNIYYVDKPFWTVDTLFWSIVNKEKALPKYLFYVLSKIDLASLNVGSAVPSLTVPVLNDLKVNLPPLPEQKAIAHILGKLDDKIELNRQMNQTLEAMAQALFKSWFVDFNPVLDNTLAVGNPIPEALQAKAEKRKAVTDNKKLLATNPELAAQFPSAFVFNETLDKWIPEGWEVKTAGEVATVVGGGTPSTKIEEYYSDNGIPWLSPKDLSGYEWKYISKGAKDITELGLQKSSAKMMPAGTVVFSSRAPIGYVAIAENDLCTNQGFKSLIPDKGVPGEYLFQFLKANTDMIDSVASGSTFKEVSGSAIKGLNVVVPHKDILNSFSSILEAGNKKSLINQNETETLAQLRDTLLPQLISGKVRVNPEHFE